MEDVLEVYHREYPENEVLVCLDETSKQLVGETRTPLPPQPGSARAYDFEYQRNGVSNLFMLFAPLEGWRRVEVTQRRTKADWAQVVRKLATRPETGLKLDRRVHRTGNFMEPGHGATSRIYGFVHPDGRESPYCPA